MFFFFLYTILGVIGIMIYVICLIGAALYYPIWRIFRINEEAGIQYPRDLFIW